MPNSLVTGEEKFDVIFPPALLQGVASAVAGKSLKESESLDSAALAGLVLTALGDESALIRAAGVYVASSLKIEVVMPIFESYIDTDGNGEKDLDRADRAAAGIALVMGQLANRSKDKAFCKTVELRISNLLYCPSDFVKEKSAEGLGALVKVIPAEEAKTILDSFKKELADPKADAKAAAFGIAGVVKGLTSRSLRSHGVLSLLQTAIDDKKNPKAREGALWAYTALSVTLGHIFEPYAAHAIPSILSKLGDKAPEVRSAAEAALQAALRTICPQGLAVVVPILVEALNARTSWQTSVGCLSAFASQVQTPARAQLAARIAPVMAASIDALSDTKPEVQDAARRALSALAAELITSPEMRAMVPSLLQAIFSPGEETMPCVEKLMDVTFVNPIDGPCLSLMVPVLSRALKERRVEFKRRASLVVGNMCALVIDGRALIPYAPALLPDLAACVKDSNPEMRQYGASALTALLKGMASAHLSQRFDNMVGELDRLQRDMVAEKAEVRAAAEQGLQELIELAASQATKVDHTEADVAAEAARLEAEAAAAAAAAAAEAAAAEAARRKAEEEEAAGPSNFILQKEAALAEQELKDKQAKKDEEKRLKEEARVRAEEEKKKAFEKFQKEQAAAAAKHKAAKKKK